MSFTIGSLFDGSGGFPLAASMCGGTPKWASEIEPYPIAVTTSRFPNVKHLGSVTDINGGEVEPVDVITFGSPCQDLSVAGKRAGLKHEANGDEETTRSGLFMEAVRIIKEMREATNGVYPRFALWENVPGAFSSNKGEDFRIVLEELIKIVEPTAVMPEVPKAGWPYADSYCGDGWSIAYRVLDAQFWGVPQRRRRIYLVADFRGECAGEVLFEREGLRGYFAEGRTPWQTVAGDAENGSGATDCEGIGIRNLNGGDFQSKTILDPQGIAPSLYAGECRYGGGELYVLDKIREIGTPIAVDQGGGKSGANYHHDLSPTLTCTHGGEPAVADSFDALSSNSMKSRNPHSGCRQVEIAKCLDTTDPNPCKNQGGIAIVEQVPYLLKIRSGCEGGGKGALIQEDMSATLATNNDQYLFQPVVMGQRAFCKSARARTSAVAFQTYQKVTGPLMANSHPGSYTGQDAFSDMLVAGTYQDTVGALCARDYKGVGSQYVNEDKVVVEATGVDCRNATEYPEMIGALQADAAHNLNSNNVVRVNYIVRRLTPTECARLQGFPDTWGHPNVKTDLTDEEYQFWLNVRNTHAAINDKATKDYTKEQILKWYNSLHTDSSEYKMWGNGIALPNALYVMQGIADVMDEEKASRKKWLDELLGGCL